jgi:hypothetical protein
MLELGFKSPHGTIDHYIMLFADFEPTDGMRWLVDEPSLGFIFLFRSKVDKFSFDKMSECDSNVLPHCAH